MANLARQPLPRRFNFATRHLNRPVAAASTHPSPGRALSALRAATAAHHARIDRLLDLPRMADSHHYGRVLQVFDAFLGPWEERVAAALPAEARSWLRQGSRRAFLRDDLRWLGLPRIAAPARQVALASPAEAWGSLYVLEGSALGGQVITRAVAVHGFSIEAGAAFFHGWGAATGARWREFRELLEARLVQPEDTQAACAAAAATFDALTASFQAHLHERPALA